MPTAQVDFEKNIAGWWREVKDDFWGDVKQETLKLVKLLLEASMKEELVVYTQAEWHARTLERHPYRNGFSTRALSTELGEVTDLRVPRSRDGGFPPTVLPRYARRQPAVHGLLQDVFLSRGAHAARRRGRAAAARGAREGLHGVDRHAGARYGRHPVPATARAH